MAGSSDPKFVKVHDFFNLFALGVIVLIDLLYLYLATDWKLIWTPTLLGKESEELFSLFHFIFVSYLVIDSIWIFFFPQCVLSNPDGILFHHLVCLPLTFIPIFHRQYSWYMVFSLCSEVNTFLIILRRHLVLGTLLHTICNAAFYISWIVLRLLLFSFLCILYVFEYLKISKELGTFRNITLLAPICQSVITVLNWKWTVDLLKKSSGERKTKQ